MPRRKLRIDFRTHQVRKSAWAIDFREQKGVRSRRSRPTLISTNLSQPERHEACAPAARDARLRSGCGTCASVCRLGGHGQERSQQLARQGLVARIRGGARALAAGPVGGRLRLADAARGRRASARSRGPRPRWSNEGEAVALDASTTAYYLALELCVEEGARRRHERPARRDGARGRIRHHRVADGRGAAAVRHVPRRRSRGRTCCGRRGSTRASSAPAGSASARGLMDLNPDEVRIKQEMADACDQVYGIFDGTKWHRSALLSFVAADDLTGIVTDSSAPIAEVEAWRAAGADVITVDPGPGGAPPVRPRDLRRAMPVDEEPVVENSRFGTGDERARRTADVDSCSGGRLGRRDGGGPRHARRARLPLEPPRGRPGPWRTRVAATPRQRGS